MPGQLDVWNHVTFLDLLRPRSARSQADHRTTTELHPDGPGPVREAASHRVADDAPRPRRRVLLVATLATACAVLAGGSIAVASAHKSVTLDVDGELVRVTTFAGSVDGLLAEQGIELGERDVVAPTQDDALADGGDVVVRHARQVTVLADGEESTVWTTALSAEEALETLETRAQDVRLVAARSAATGRPELAVHLNDGGPVDLVVDGRTERIEDGSTGVAELLEQRGVTVGDLDRVHVYLPGDAPPAPPAPAEASAVPADAPEATGEAAEAGVSEVTDATVTEPEAAVDAVPAVTVVVQRVVAEERVTLTEIPFEQVVEQTDALYKGQRRTEVAGATGERTTVHRVITVDGVDESSVQLSDLVTRAPVTEVVREGTKARPAPAPTGGTVVTGDVWGALAKCESGGNPTAVSSSGKYHGLYQFSVGTWQAVGGAGLPSEASAEEQTQRAQALQARSGWGQWPACAAKLGLL